MPVAKLNDSLMTDNDQCDQAGKALPQPIKLLKVDHVTRSKQANSLSQCRTSGQRVTIKVRLISYCIVTSDRDAHDSEKTDRKSDGCVCGSFLGKANSAFRESLLAPCGSTVWRLVEQSDSANGRRFSE